MKLLRIVVALVGMHAFGANALEIMTAAEQAKLAEIERDYSIDELLVATSNRQSLLMQREHFGRRQAWFRIVVALVQIPIGLVHPPARGLHWSPAGRLKAVRDHLRGRYGPPPEDVLV